MNAATTIAETLAHPPFLTAVVQVGATGVWGRFQVPASLSLQTDDWVVCQTGRGLELGRLKLLLPSAERLPSTDISGEDGPPSEDNISDEAHPPGEETVGPILRVATDADLLTRQRIERATPQGIAACNQWLADNDFPQIVLDVDVPLDGLRIYFHFLGDVDRRLDAATDTLVELFDQAAEIRRFTQAVAVGCGPSCGSDGSGCHGSGGTSDKSAKSGCASCALSGGCGKR